MGTGRISARESKGAGVFAPASLLGEVSSWACQAYRPGGDTISVSYLLTISEILSSRAEPERAAADLVVQDLSTREFSRALYISEYTVQDHLSNAFDKVGVRGRRAFRLQRRFGSIGSHCRSQSSAPPSRRERRR